MMIADHLREATVRLEAAATLGAASVMRPDDFSPIDTLVAVVQLVDRANRHVRIVGELVSA